jgi:hypothetical protein
MRLRSLIVLFGLLAVAGCGTEQASAPRTVSIEGSSRFPDAGVRDWVSYADHVVVFTVASDREVVNPTAEELAAGEYVIGREATLTIDRKLWSAPNAPALPATITMDVKGWAVANGQRLAMVAAGEPRLEVGQRYVAPVLLMDDRSPAEWWPLTVGSMLRLDTDRVRPALPEGQASGRELAGQSISGVERAVESQPPDPVVQRFRHLRPAQRVQRALAARDAETPP